MVVESRRTAAIGIVPVGSMGEPAARRLLELRVLGIRLLVDGMSGSAFHAAAPSFSLTRRFNSKKSLARVFTILLYFYSLNEIDDVRG